MQKLVKPEKLAIFAKVLIFISFAFISYGVYLDLQNEKKLIDPVKDVEIIKEESTVSITPSDTPEVTPENIVNPPTEDPIVPVTPQTPGPVVVPKEEPKTLTIDEINNNLRVEIQNAYGIKISYGEETRGYTVAGVSTAPIENSNTINYVLQQLKATLALYPKELFTEIKNGGMPLTILLINHYSEKSVTGVTDSSYSYANISIAAIYPFQESFYHESYHYIERYLFKKGANFNSWNTLNPEGFEYGTIYRDLSYANTFSETAPFVNNYAQTQDTEDRASTFEYMMADSKASCLNNGTIVWKKAKYMANMLETVLNTVNPNTIEHWERYL